MRGAYWSDITIASSNFLDKRSGGPGGSFNGKITLTDVTAAMEGMLAPSGMVIAGVYLDNLGGSANVEVRNSQFN